MTHSLWMEDMPPPAAAALDGDATTDVAIVGAGMAGLATAWYLAQQGIPCAVLERQRIAGGASGRNAGIILVGLGEHYARSIVRYGRERACEIWRVNALSHRRLREIVVAETLACEYRRQGSFALAWDESEAEDLQASVAPLYEDGFGAELVNEQFIVRATGCHGVPLGLYTREDAEVHPVRLVRGMARALDRYGVRCFENTPVLDIIPRSRSGFTLRTPHGGLICDRVVLATNAYTPLLRPECRDLVKPVRGQCLAARVPAALPDAAPCFMDRGHAYWRRYKDHLVVGGFERLSPSTEQGYADETISAIQNALESLLAARFPSLAAGVEGIRAGVTHRWSGVMGYGYDWFPFVGERPAGSGLYLNLGFTGHGFGYAFQSAWWIAEAISGRNPTIPAFLDAGRSTTRRDQALRV